MSVGHAFQHLANLKKIAQHQAHSEKVILFIQGQITRTHAALLSSGSCGSHCGSVVTLFETQPSLLGIRSLFNKELYENLPIVRGCHLKFICLFIHVTYIY